MKSKSIKQLSILLILIITAPILLNISFKALKIYTKQPEVYIAYTLISLSTIIALFTIYYGFKAFKTVLDAIFKK